MKQFSEKLRDMFRHSNQTWLEDSHSPTKSGFDALDAFDINYYNILADETFR